MACIIKGMRQLMGTFVRITVAHPCIDEAKETVQAAFNEMYRVQELMSVYSEGSEVSTLNRYGSYQGISADTRHVIRKANYYSGLSEGAFDITVLPLLKVWEEWMPVKTPPSEAKISGALESVDYTNIAVENDNIMFKKAGMAITLAGIAKGYAIDRAIGILKQGNIKHALVNGGGDIRVIGGKTGSLPWRVAVRDPIKKRIIGDTYELRERAIATSGTYNRPYHDIFNPKVGRPSRECLSSTVIADKAIDADTLATCLYILGVERGMALLGKLDGIEALLITRDGETIKYPDTS